MSDQQEPPGPPRFRINFNFGCGTIALLLIVFACIAFLVYAALRTPTP